MQTVTINFTVSGQTLTGASLPIGIASNTVEYVKAKFALGSDWTGFDSVRAIWYNDYAQIATVLDGNGECTVPWEVLAKTDDVRVNLVGSDVENDALVDRLTTYPAKALDVDANAKITGTETAPVTPSQFEQYIAIVEQLVGSVKDIDHTELNADYTLTIYYTDGTSDTVGPIRGAQGETGNGILSAVLNPDYTLTLNYTNGQHDTVGPIRGAQGETGNGIQSIYLTGTSGAVKTYTILFTDGNTTEFQVTDGEVTNAVLESLMPTDTASGAIASFPDGQSVFPLKSLVADINPIQDLHGYDSPWVGGAGANKWDEDWEVGIYNNSGSPESSSSNIRSKNAIPVSSSTTYYAYVNGAPTLKILYYDSTDTFISYEPKQRATFTTPANASYVRFSTINYGGTTYKNDIAINYPSTVTTYSPYANICPISGWNSVGVVDCGKNLLDESIFVSLCSAVKQNDGSYYIQNLNSAYNKTIYTNLKKYSGQFSITFIRKQTTTGKGLVLVAHYTDGTTDKIGNSSSNADAVSTFTLTTNASKTLDYLVWDYGSNYSSYINVQIELGSTTTAYEAYNGTTYTTSLGQTVYGGTLDVVSGVLTVTDVIWTGNTSTMNNNDSFPGWRNSGVATLMGTGLNRAEHDIITNVGKGCGVNTTNGTDTLMLLTTQYGLTQSEWITLAQDVQICIPLATPTTIQLTPTQVQTLLGTNNIFADSGDVSVEYVADIQGYIDKKL